METGETQFFLPIHLYSAISRQEPLRSATTGNSSVSARWICASGVPFKMTDTGVSSPGLWVSNCRAASLKMTLRVPFAFSGHVGVREESFQKRPVCGLGVQMKEGLLVGGITPQGQHPAVGGTAVAGDEEE